METQASLFDSFGGQTFIPSLDAARLSGQWKRVFNVMASGRWLTLSEIQREIEKMTGVHDSETGISARTRDFRKDHFGGHWVHSQRRGDAKRGVWEYRLEIRVDK